MHCWLINFYLIYIYIYIFNLFTPIYYLFVMYLYLFLTPNFTFTRFIYLFFYMIIPGIFITWSVHLLKESNAIITYRRYKTNSISQKHQRRPRTHFRLYVMTQFLPRWKVVSVGSGLTVYSGSWKNTSRVTKRQSDALTRMVFRLLPSNGKEINAN